ncbi:MAG: hypothetical protein HYY01_01745 [Chloroflexi bacterium]|nr:hypothetical protein [Chloroflexota bacterium]
MSEDDLRREIETLRKRLDSEARMRGTVIRALTEAFVRAYGPGALAVAARAHAEMSRPLLERLMAKNALPRDARGAVQLLTMLHTMGGVEGEVADSTPMRATRRERKCPFQDVWTADMCRQFSPAIMEVICRVVGPGLTTFHTSYLSAGDPTCDIVFEMQE